MAWMKNKDEEWKNINQPCQSYTEIGQSFCYPLSDFGFRVDNVIPESVARLWLQEKGIRINRDYDSTDYANNCNQWLNKLAIVIYVDPFLKIVCLYNHDGLYMIISKEI